MFQYVADHDQFPIQQVITLHSLDIYILYCITEIHNGYIQAITVHIIITGTLDT